MIALGLGLKTAGYDVLLVTHDVFEELITSRGLGFFPVQGNPIDVMQSEEGQRWLSAGVKALSERIRAEDGVGRSVAVLQGFLQCD